MPHVVYGSPRATWDKDALAPTWRRPGEAAGRLGQCSFCLGLPGSMKVGTCRYMYQLVRQGPRVPAALLLHRALCLQLQHLPAAQQTRSKAFVGARRSCAHRQAGSAPQPCATQPRSQRSHQQPSPLPPHPLPCTPHTCITTPQPGPPQLVDAVLKGGPLCRVLRPAPLQQAHVVIQARKALGVGAGQLLLGGDLQAHAIHQLAHQLRGRREEEKRRCGWRGRGFVGVCCWWWRSGWWRLGEGSRGGGPEAQGSSLRCWLHMAGRERRQQLTPQGLTCGHGSWKVTAGQGGRGHSMGQWVPLQQEHASKQPGLACRHAAQPSQQTAATHAAPTSRRPRRRRRWRWWRTRR